MSVVHVQAEDALNRLEVSRTRLLRAAPDLSAAKLVGKRQWTMAAGAAFVVLVCTVLWPMVVLQITVAVCTLAYFTTVAHRVAVTVLSRRTGAVLVVTDEEALAASADELPTYTVLVPAYREPEVIDTLMTNLGALDYPASKLDLKLLLEADDAETVERALRHPLADSVEIVLVPPGEPRTKPKALNYGLTLARGDLVTIYDAEDEPDTLQLRRAAVAFGRAPDDLACMQAQLTYRNPNQNLITRWFTVEYLMWFTLFLPGLAITDAPIPLGGTSNHIRRSALEGMGGWDPYNVTEDADLGVRLHRVGWRCGVLGSVTYEEANSDFVNWMKQRSRWYKGYLQTWLVHLRHPVRLWRELGGLGFLQFNLFVGGTPLLALLNPVFWTLTILWFLGRFPFIQALFPTPVYYAGLACWGVGNLAVLYMTVLAARKAESPSLVVAALLVPLYWVMMSMSAIKAAVQLVFQPSFWEKTTHGLDGAETPGSGAGPSPVDAVGGAGTIAAEVLDPSIASSGAPALAVARARSVTTAAQLRAGARALRATGMVLVALVVWLLAGTALVARVGAGGRAAQAIAPATSTTAVPTEGTPVAQLTSSAIDLDATVLQGTAVSTLDRGVGHAASSALLGGGGRVVLMGHRRLAGGPLRHLAELERGDRIAADTPWGTATYEVTSLQTISADAVDLRTTPAERLTIVTATKGRDVLQVDARLVSKPIAALPAPTPGYPTLALGLPAQWLLAALWAAVAALAWTGRRLLVRALGSPGVVAAGVVAVLCLLEAFVAVGHALPGLT